MGDYLLGELVGDLSGIWFLYKLVTNLLWFIPVFLLVIIPTVIGNWKLFQKAGESGWKALIPFYSGYTFYKLCWKVERYWIELGFVLGYFIISFSGLGFISKILLCGMLVMYVLLCIRTAFSYGKDGGFAVGMILLPGIFTLILAFGEARYIGPTGFGSMSVKIGHSHEARRTPKPEPEDHTVDLNRYRQQNVHVEKPAEKPAVNRDTLSVKLEEVKTHCRYAGKVNGRKMIVGRSETKAQLCIPKDNSVSGAHLLLEMRDGSLLAKDNGSVNGTKFNGVKSAHTVRLKQGDRISIGKGEYKITWKYSAS